MQHVGLGYQLSELVLSDVYDVLIITCVTGRISWLRQLAEAVLMVGLGYWGKPEGPRGGGGGGGEERVHTDRIGVKLSVLAAKQSVLDFLREHRGSLCQSCGARGSSKQASCIATHLFPSLRLGISCGHCER